MPDFHHYDDARDIWMAFKARFGENEESKKMRKTMLKQQFTEFYMTEEEGLHKGYDKFQKILSQLNQVQVRPDNDDINMKFLRALPSSWSQVALALKTRGGLESLELDVRIGHNYGVKATVAPIYSAFVGASSSGSKPGYSDQKSIVPIVSQTFGHSDNIMECVLHSFVAENDSDQDMIYEDFDQVDQIEMEELDLKWQLAMLSLRINRFVKKAGRKINYNNKQPAKFDRMKARCYKCLQLGHFARECKVKTVDDKARYSAYKAENKTGVVEKMYGMMAGLNGYHAAKGATSVSDAAVEFAMMGISPQESSKNLNKLINSSMSIRTKLSLGFKQYFGEDEIFDLSIPSTLDPEPIEKRFPPLSKSFVKAGEMHEVPPSITGTFMPTSYKSDLIETQVSYGLKSDSKTSETSSETNDFVSCDNSDKSSDSKAYVLCDSSPETKTKDSPTTVDVKTVPESDIEDP
nr:hypothetical protein [Tanacetum cinerariifolium]